ncbi:MAG TPA: hypothetical protein VFG54_13865 [Prolixibacteraceae bacterium]|nr:hypothetical protein [Prolixibacteraceae bacterium]
MAKVMDGASSKLSGKADGRVYVQFNGGTYTRSLPRRTKDSTTPGMLLNQRRFREVNQFCSQFKTSLIPQIWNGTNKRMSGYALFLKSNMAAFGADGSIVDVKKIKLSTGKLPFPVGFEARRSEMDGNLIEVSWPKEMHVGGVHMKDELMVISAQEGVYSDIKATGITKADLKGSFELPALFSESTHIYLFFSSKDHREYSESVCYEI